MEHACSSAQITATEGEGGPREAPNPSAPLHPCSSRGLQNLTGMWVLRVFWYPFYLPGWEPPDGSSSQRQGYSCWRTRTQTFWEAPARKTSDLIITCILQITRLNDRIKLWSTYCIRGSAVLGTLRHGWIKDSVLRELKFRNKRGKTKRIWINTHYHYVWGGRTALMTHKLSKLFITFGSFDN